jgi:putative heme-binding domain-containing protein
MAQSLSQRLQGESPEALARDARQKGDAARGAILFTQPSLSCARCHAPGVTRPVGPDLNALGGDVTDTYLVEALLDPSKAIRKGFESVTVVTATGKVLLGRMVEESPEKIVLQVSSGDLERVTLSRAEIEEVVPSKLSAMPANLVDQLANRDQFLDLVRYLMSLKEADPTRTARARAEGGQNVRPELQGLVLLKEFHCAACHPDDVTETQLADKQPPNLLRSAGRINPHFVRQFIADPWGTKPGTTMPDVMARLPANERQVAAEEITHYLALLGDQEYSVPQVDGAAAARGRELFHTVGCVACHSPRDDQHRELLKDASVPLGPVQHKYSLDGLVAFLKNPLDVRPSGRMPKMKLTHWEAVDLANYLLSQPRKDSFSKPFELDPQLAAKGKARFGQLGCRQCHRVDSSDAPPASLPLSQVRWNRGCLSGESGTWPEFRLTSAQHTAIQTALRPEAQELSEHDQIAVALTAFRCLNCHQRDELGGVSAERDPHFQTENLNLGPQGRIPPTLTGVGAKLNPAWMRQVLVNGRTSRPYVLTRMPQYGTENVEHLVDLFKQADQLPPLEFAESEDEKEMKKVGAEMVGTGGLNCIACHTFQWKKAANMPAVDLTEMAERLQKNWFYHYMRDPQRLSPNTIMPSFWPGGRAMRRDILEGDRDLQVEALWQYLLDGRQARTPRGLILEPLELLATDEAVMLRRSYPGIGKRGIGVGYPGQVNLAFDAEQMRLAMIWKGKFADPAGVWRSQGHGRVRPLGDNLIQFAPGPDLDDGENPWTVDEGRPPQHQFKGYSLDAMMRPRFKYRFAGIRVEDYPVDLVDPSTGRPFIRRTVLLTSDTDRGKLAFRAATGKSITRSGDGVFRVDDHLSVRIDGSHTGRIVDGADFQQLHIPLTVVDGSTSLTLEYRW